MVDLNAFDNFAIQYDKWFDDHELEYALELEAIRVLLPKEGRGIEIGAGTGRFTQPLGISLGIEPSEAMRRLAIKRGVNIIAGTAESLPLDDGTYDFALLVTTVCFLEKPELAFKEVFRILKINGSVIIGIIDKDSKLGKKYEERKKDNVFYKNAIFHSVREIKSKLEKSGFHDIEYAQALLPGDSTEESDQKVKQGYGEGSFIVIRAQKYIE